MFPLSEGHIGDAKNNCCQTVAVMSNCIGDVCGFYAHLAHMKQVFHAKNPGIQRYPVKSASSQDGEDDLCVHTSP